MTICSNFIPAFAPWGCVLSHTFWWRARARWRSRAPGRLMRKIPRRWACQICSHSASASAAPSRNSCPLKNHDTIAIQPKTRVSRGIHLCEAHSAHTVLHLSLLTCILVISHLPWAAVESDVVEWLMMSPDVTSQFSRYESVSEVWTKYTAYSAPKSPFCLCVCDFVFDRSVALLTYTNAKSTTTMVWGRFFKAASAAATT